LKKCLRASKKQFMTVEKHTPTAKEQAGIGGLEDKSFDKRANQK